MHYNGSAFYDNDVNFQNYMQRRQGRENANDTLELPVIQQLLGNVTGMSVLDLGCGDARLGALLLDLGCSAYTGVEGSRNMAEAASRTLEGSIGTVVHTKIEDYSFSPEAHDIVISRLVLHYIQDASGVIRRIHHTLKPGGRFIFSVEHPVITSTLQPSGIRTNWVVDNYFVEGYREQQWLGGTVHKYHRTVEDYFMALTDAGFRVESLRESKPDRERFVTEETYERRQRIPLFLFMAGKKDV